MNLLKKYKSLVIQVEQAQRQLDSLQAELLSLERQIEGGGGQEAARALVPPRLQYLVDMFVKAGGRMSLNDVSKKVKITRTGVWNQINKLIELGCMRQVDRGLYELIRE